MGIKVKIDVQLWIPEWRDEPEVWVSMYSSDKAVYDDYMRLGVMEVELPYEMPSKAEISAYRNKTARTRLLTSKKQVEEELKRLERRLNQEFRDAYEIEGYERIDDSELGGR